MNFSEAIRQIRQGSYLSQHAFADALGIAFSTVNRWENGRAIPNYQTMKRILSYCKAAQIDAASLEQSWKEAKTLDTQS